MSNNYSLQTPQSISIVPRSEAIKTIDNFSEASLSLAENSSFNIKLKAALCKQAMDNTAALATAEAFYNQIAPAGRDDYRLIVKAYTKLAILEMIRGDL